MGLLSMLGRRRCSGESGRLLWAPPDRDPPEALKLEADGESLRRLAGLWPDLKAGVVPDSGGRQWLIEVSNLPGFFRDETGEFKVRPHQRFELRLAPGYTSLGFRFFSLLPLVGPHVTITDDREVCLTGDLRFLRASHTLAARAVPILANVVSLRDVNPLDVHDLDSWYWLRENDACRPLSPRDYRAELEPALDDALADLERRLGWRPE